jgi:hypothetical protein
MLSSSPWRGALHVDDARRVLAAAVVAEQAAAAKAVLAAVVVGEMPGADAIKDAIKVGAVPLDSMKTCVESALVCSEAGI